MKKLLTIPNTIGDVAECIQKMRSKPVGSFQSVMDRVEQGNCPQCDCRVVGFTDELSKTEYKISGLCQQCQDDFFGAGGR